MKKIAALFIAAVAAASIACSKDADINAFISELDATTQEITSKIDASPNIDGVNAAQKAFDARKAALKSKWDSIKDAMGFQVSADTKKKLEDSAQKNLTALQNVFEKHSMTLAEDDKAVDKFQSLMKEYGAIFGEVK